MLELGVFMFLIMMIKENYLLPRKKDALSVIIKNGMMKVC